MDRGLIYPEDRREEVIRLLTEEPANLQRHRNKKEKHVLERLPVFADVVYAQ